MSDAFYSDVTTLCPMRGFNTSTTIDNYGSSSVTLSCLGQAKIVTSQSKYGISSLDFDGNGDYLQSASNEEWNFSEKGDFTFEFWAKFDTFNAGADRLFGIGGGSVNWADADTALQCILSRLNGGNLRLEINNGGSSGSANTSGAPVNVTGVWQHYALVHDDSANTLKLYIDGTEEASLSTASWRATTTPPRFEMGTIPGENATNTNAFDGQVEDLRLTSAVRYTSAFTVPSKSFYVETPTDANSSDVVLLLPFDGTDGDTSTTDQSPSSHTMSFLGNAEIDSAQAQWGDTSAVFDGTTDRITAPDDTALQMGSGNFTFECYFYIDAGGVGSFRGIYTKRNSNAEFREFSVYLDSSNRLNLVASNNGTSWTTVINPSTVPASGSWAHLAAVRDSSNLRLFLNGSQLGSGSVTGTLSSNTADAVIGALGSNGDFSYHGWIDDVRLTKGVARYTANFNPPPYALYKPSGVTFSIPAGSISLTGYAPTFTAVVPPVTFPVPSGSITITGFSPVFSVGQGFPVPTGNIVITGYAPVLTSSTGSGSAVILKHQEGVELLDMTKLQPGEMAINLTTGKIWAIGDDWTVYEMSGYYDGTDLPRTDPGVAGSFWNDDGTLKVSSG